MLHPKLPQVVPGVLVKQVHPMFIVQVSKERIGDDLALVLIKNIEEVIDLHFQLANTIGNILKARRKRIVGQLNIWSVLFKGLFTHQEGLHPPNVFCWCYTIFRILSISDHERVGHVLDHLLHLHFTPCRCCLRINAGKQFQVIFVKKMLFFLHAAKVSIRRNNFRGASGDAKLLLCGMLILLATFT